MSFHYVSDNHILMLICRLVSISYGTFLRPSPLGPQIFWALVKKYVPITALDLPPTRKQAFGLQPQVRCRKQGTA